METTNEMDRPNLFVVYENEKGEAFESKDAAQLYGIIKEHEIKLGKKNRKRKKYEIRVSVLDRLNNESEISEPVVVKL